MEDIICYSCVIPVAVSRRVFAGEHVSSVPLPPVLHRDEDQEVHEAASGGEAAPAGAGEDQDEADQGAASGGTDGHATRSRKIFALIYIIMFNFPFSIGTERLFQQCDSQLQVVRRQRQFHPTNGTPRTG